MFKNLVVQCHTEIVCNHRNHDMLVRFTVECDMKLVN